MLDANIPMSLQCFLLAFTPCFTKPGLRIFASLVAGWICCSGRHSIARLIQASSAPPEKHHSGFYRFLAQGAWVTDSLAKTLFHLLLPLLPKSITLIVDDTLCTKGGPHIFGAAMHYDARSSTYGRKAEGGAKKSFAFGHNWVVAALWVPLPWCSIRGVAIPFMSRLYRSRKRCPKGVYRKRTELATDILTVIASWLPTDRQLLVIGDSEYACQTVVKNLIVKSLPDRVFFIGPMVMNAALYDLPPNNTKPRLGRPPVKGKRMLSPKALGNSKSIPWKKMTLTIYGQHITLLVKSQKCLWYTVAGTQLVTMVVTRDPAGRLSDRVFFSTDQQMSVEHLLACYSRRWEIEVAFRNAKQAMGIEDPQNGWWRRKHGSARPAKTPGPNPHESKGEATVNHTLALAFAAYALVVIWYFYHGNPDQDVARVKKEAPWYRHKEAPSFVDMLAAIRRELWVTRFSRDPDLDRLPEKIDDVLPHWLLAA
jgi:hypothetical protein